MLPTTSSRVILPSLLKHIPAPLLPGLAPPPQLLFSTAAASSTFAPSAARLFSSAASRRFLPSAPVNRIRQFSTSPLLSFAPTTATMGVAVISNRSDFNNAVEVSKLKTASDSPKLVVIDCHAVWCGPCKAIAPKINEYSEKYTDVAFYKVDVDEVPDVAQELGVRAMPTFVYYKNGEKVDEVMGASPPNIENAIKKHSGAA